MQERVWTDEQKLAIDTRDRSLLVSAAAGSGKTATLTERIIRSVLEKDASITDMLIVTFTNAAVGELRERINSTLSEALAKDPANDDLRRELLLLPSAKICTIDSYCGELVRQNAESIGISPSYRICDSAEAEHDHISGFLSFESEERKRRTGILGICKEDTGTLVDHE